MSRRLVEFTSHGFGVGGAGRTDVPRVGVWQNPRSVNIHLVELTFHAVGVW